MLLDRLLVPIAPHHCLGCAAEGELVCAGCRRDVLSRRSSCFLCNRITENFRLCPACRRKTRLSAVVVATYYEGIVKELIAQLKFERNVAAATTAAALITDRLRGLDFDLVTCVPSSARRFRQRGYNQADLIAKTVARQLRLPYCQLLGRIGSTHQVGASRKERLRQVVGTVYPRRRRIFYNQRVLIIDDVVTTGATLSECARVLRNAGASRVVGAAVARH